MWTAIADMGLLEVSAGALLYVYSWIYNLIFFRNGIIPEPSVFLRAFLNAYFPNEKLLQLEFLTGFYRKNGLFKFDGKIYIFETRLAQTAINKLEKGAEEYLKNSPLKDTFLGSSSKSPEVRRAVAALFRKTTIEENGHLIIKDVDNMCTRIAREADNGLPINITDWSLRMALDVVGHMLLQLDLFALEGQQRSLLNSLLTILHRCYALAEIGVDSPEFKKASDDLERLTSKILEDALTKDDPQEDKRLVKKLHEACGFESARDNMKLFLMAGSETTASTIPILFYLLIKHPQIQDELRQEADDLMEELKENPALAMPKTEAVLKELLRVYPIAPFISRRTFDKVTVGNITVDANSDLVVFTWGIHRSEFHWPLAKDFQPFRFLRQGPSDRPTSNMYIPFGAGSRICIGQHLAWLELKLATAILLHKFIFKPCAETPDLKFVVDWAHAVVHPDKDMLFHVESRI